MKMLKNKIVAIVISIFFVLSMTVSLTIIPDANAHTPSWNIPTYAYIVATPNPIGVGQTATLYLWLDEVYGAAGGTAAAVGTNGGTASAALIANSYRFLNYNLTIVSPTGAATTTIFPKISDTTSNQITTFTPTTTGTYKLIFTYPGQVYGANGNGYSGSVLINDTYLPSSASTTLVVQQAPIPAAISSEPLPSSYWTRPIYGENSNWWSISSNWLGIGAGGYVGFSTALGGSAIGPDEANFHPDAIGPLTSHVMWTAPIQTGGVVGGNQYDRRLVPRQWSRSRLLRRNSVSAKICQSNNSRRITLLHATHRIHRSKQWSHSLR